MRGLADASGVGEGVAGPQERPATLPRPAAGERGLRGLRADAGQPECGGRVGGVAVAQGPHPLPGPELSARSSGAGRRASHPQTKLSEWRPATKTSCCIPGATQTNHFFCCLSGLQLYPGGYGHFTQYWSSHSVYPLLYLGLYRFHLVRLLDIYRIFSNYRRDQHPACRARARGLRRRRISVSAPGLLGASEAHLLFFESSLMAPLSLKRNKTARRTRAALEKQNKTWAGEGSMDWR